MRTARIILRSLVSVRRAARLAIREYVDKRRHPTDPTAPSPFPVPDILVSRRSRGSTPMNDNDLDAKIPDDPSIDFDRIPTSTLVSAIREHPGVAVNIPVLGWDGIEYPDALTVLADRAEKLEAEAGSAVYAARVNAGEHAKLEASLARVTAERDIARGTFEGCRKVWNLSEQEVEDLKNENARLREEVARVTAERDEARLETTSEAEAYAGNWHYECERAYRAERDLDHERHENDRMAVYVEGEAVVRKKLRDEITALEAKLAKEGSRA